MMMALKSGQLAGLETKAETYQGIAFGCPLLKSDESADRYRYNPSLQIPPLRDMAG